MLVVVVSILYAAAAAAASSQFTSLHPPPPLLLLLLCVCHTQQHVRKLLTAAGCRKEGKQRLKANSYYNCPKVSIWVFEAWWCFLKKFSQIQKTRYFGGFIGLECLKIKIFEFCKSLKYAEFHQLS